MPELAALLFCDRGCSGAGVVLADEAGCCAEDVIAPVVPPVAGVWEELLPIEADEVEQVSDSLFTLETVMALLPELLPVFALALAEPELVCAPACAPPAKLPMICTCWPTWLCSMLLSPCN